MRHKILQHGGQVNDRLDGACTHLVSKVATAIDQSSCYRAPRSPATARQRADACPLRADR
jgi:hypothetical protein